MKTRRYLVLASLLAVVLVFGAVIFFTIVANTNVAELNTATGPIHTTTNEMGILTLPLEGVIIKGNQSDLEEYLNAGTQEEKDKVLEKLLNDSDNVVIHTEKKNPPSSGGEAVPMIPG